jgi:hypothetical protein
MNEYIRTIKELSLAGLALLDGDVQFFLNMGCPQSVPSTAVTCGMKIVSTNNARNYIYIFFVSFKNNVFFKITF